MFYYEELKLKQSWLFFIKLVNVNQSFIIYFC